MRRITSESAPLAGPSADVPGPPVVARSAEYLAIHAAMLGRMQVWCLYKGYERALCVHVLGLNKQGLEQALCYQFGGYSSTGLLIPGSPVNWRCMRLSEMSDVRLVSGDWHTATEPAQSVSRTVSFQCVATIHYKIGG